MQTERFSDGIETGGGVLLLIPLRMSAGDTTSK
jgi:hypothetical protein